MSRGIPRGETAMVENGIPNVEDAIYGASTRCASEWWIPPIPSAFHQALTEDTRHTRCLMILATNDAGPAESDGVGDGITIRAHTFPGSLNSFDAHLVVTLVFVGFIFLFAAVESILFPSQLSLRILDQLDQNIQDTGKYLYFLIRRLVTVAICKARFTIDCPLFNPTSVFPYSIGGLSTNRFLINRRFRLDATHQRAINWHISPNPWLV